jgi:hypothetical protein
MATVTHRCDLCSSEILGARRGSAPHICVLCRLSAEEGLGDEPVHYSAPGFRLPKLIPNFGAEHTARQSR